MNSRKIVFLIIFLIGFFNSFVKAQDDIPQPLAEVAKDSAVDSIVSRYYEWDEMSISGKLSGPMLPMTASVKLYMQRDSLVLISISGPLVGEVARIEIDNERVLGVNKMQNTYSTVEIEEIEPVFPGGLSAIQNLLLGRVTIVGSGELNQENAPFVDIYDMESGWLIWPLTNNLPEELFEYIYVIDGDNYLIDKFAVMSEEAGIGAECTYQWNKKDMAMDMEFQLPNGVMSATLKLNNPDAKTKKMNRIELNSKYKEVSLRKLLAK
ncbi:MAG: DUF4292 domain-containing protein [Muribaculaceae bacterium]|nr:DUF4292 domain-containing protein [Muribaculaceae bacterium]